MRDVLQFLKFFFGIIRLKMFVWLFLALCAACLEGVGVSLFLPILEGKDADSEVAEYTKAALAFFDLEYSFTTLLIIAVVFFCLKGCFFVGQDAFIKWIVSRLFIDFRVKGITQYFHVNYLYSVTKNIGYVNNALTIEYPRVITAFERCLGLIVSVIFALIYFVIPFLLEPLVALSVCVAGMPAYYIFYRLNGLTRKYSVAGVEAGGQLQKFMIQALNHFKYLKTTHVYQGILGKIRQVSEKLGDLFFKQSLIQATTTSSVEPLSVLLISGLLFYQVEIKGQDLLEIFFMLFLVRRAITNSLAVQQNYRRFLGLFGSVQVYETFEEELRKNDENLLRKGVAPDFERPIQFENVSFSYDEDQKILEDINFTIPPNKTVAFVGASGTGKSTIVTLLTGVLQPTNGRILLAGQDYSDLDQAHLRQSIGYVTQESVIFNDTIWNNITLWDPAAEEADVVRAAKRAQIHAFVDAAPNKYNEVLGDNGINISGGQRQRISIARELYKNTQLMIFDEATSSLDTQSEIEVQKSIDEFKGEKTVVLIAHRLSTVKNSDVIFVLKEGRIVEQGTYAELYTRQGEFKRMVDQQAVGVS